MGVVENERPFFFYHKTSQTAIGKAFDRVVTPSEGDICSSSLKPRNFSDLLEDYAN
jgi:hypothetical protein